MLVLETEFKAVGTPKLLTAVIKIPVLLCPATWDDQVASVHACPGWPMA